VWRSPWTVISGCDQRREFPFPDVVDPERQPVLTAPFRAPLFGEHQPVIVIVGAMLQLDPCLIGLTRSKEVDRLGGDVDHAGAFPLRRNEYRCLAPGEQLPLDEDPALGKVDIRPQQTGNL
jgi:hypothetical protein